jgi:ubiquitin-protein ligase
MNQSIDHMISKNIFILNNSLQEEPVEGFRVKLVNDDNLFEWEVAIFGPIDTIYEGGYFKVYINIYFIFITIILIWF